MCSFITLYITLVISLSGSVLTIGLSLGNLGWSDPEPLAACAMLSGRLTVPDCPRGPRPSPAWVPTLPAPTCCCFHTRPMSGGGGGSVPGVGT